MNLPFTVPQFVRWLAIAVAVTLAASVALIYLGADKNARTELNHKAFETVMQLVVVAGIGGAVGLVYKLIEGSVEEAWRRQQRRTDYVSRLGASFREAKAARRILRAAGLACAPASKPGVPCAPGAMPGVLTDAQRATYDEQFLVINKAQLALEALKIEAQCFPDPGNDVVLQTALGRMEHYLGDIVSEYEDMRTRQPLSFDCLPRLDEFTELEWRVAGRLRNVWMRFPGGVPDGHRRRGGLRPQANAVVQTRPMQAEAAEEECIDTPVPSRHAKAQGLLNGSRNAGSNRRWGFRPRPPCGLQHTSGPPMPGGEVRSPWSAGSEGQCEGAARLTGRRQRHRVGVANRGRPTRIREKLATRTI